MKKIDKNQIVNSIVRSNPWWAAKAPLFGDLPKRSHFHRLYDLTIQTDPRRALVLMGPRRIGKTVLLYQLINQLIEDGRNPKTIMFISLDNPVFRLSNLEELLLCGN